MFKLTRKFPNGTVLVLGIRYDRQEDAQDTRGMAPPKVFTYAALKTGGLWYLTGSGQVPTAAGWPAVERWLEKHGRVVEWVRVAGSWDAVYPADLPEVPTP
jgi:hypothetical protein